VRRRGGGEGDKMERGGGGRVGSGKVEGGGEGGRARDWG
jgi:hypothetical protein